MSEYQYYEFQAVDRPLDEAAKKALRALSSRARITATSLTNSYNWGDFHGDPAKLVEQWFDLHLYFANWGSRRLLIRLPRRLIDQSLLDAVLRDTDCVEFKLAGDNLILDIRREEVEPTGDEEEGSGTLAALAPLRAEALAGDPRLFYLLWLLAVEEGVVEEDEAEPLPGLGPMTGAIEAFTEFFALDPDLIAAAAERPAVAASTAASSAAASKIISSLPDREKTKMLTRMFDGDPHVAAELRAAIRKTLAREIDAAPIAARTVAELRQSALAVAAARKQAAAEKAAAERKRRAAEAAKAQQARLVEIARRGESVWHEVETEIERRNASGYDKATNLLFDLRALADKNGKTLDFARRLEAIRDRHATKAKFLGRIADIR